MIILQVLCHGRNFNPRSPQGERPDANISKILQDIISIHAPRRGSDKSPNCGERVAGYFNPRSPQGERRFVGGLLGNRQQFQSTLPAGGATFHSAAYVARYVTFQSTLPAGGATTAIYH